MVCIFRFRWLASSAWGGLHHPLVWLASAAWVVNPQHTLRLRLSHCARTDESIGMDVGVAKRLRWCWGREDGAGCGGRGVGGVG